MAPTSGSQVLQVTAPNGVVWSRRADGASTAKDLLQALEKFAGFHSDLSRRWNWWQEDRDRQERDALWQILGEWDNGAAEVTEEEAEAYAQARMEEFDRKLEEKQQQRADHAARSYDKDLENARRRLLRTESDVAFFTHVLQSPASPAQRDAAQRRVDERCQAADELRHQIGEPDEVIDRHGYLPTERREMNLRSHMDCWRHPRLREWATTDRGRFNGLLKIPMPDPSSMCSECQAPTEWHEYDISLRLFLSPPQRGSKAENLARLLPGWWTRCPACTDYQVRHVWGQPHAIPDFTGDQWVAMLPPLLKKVFIGAESKPRVKKEQPKPLAVVPPGPIDDVMTKLTVIQANYPTAQLRRGDGDSWEVWPS